MAIQLSTAVRNAILDALETEVGTTPILKLRTGTKPADCATADSGTVLLSETCPSDWLAAASGASKVLAGTWQATATGGGGTVGHFRLYKADGTTCVMQGSVTATAGGGDMEMDNPVLADGQTVTVPTFTLGAGNA